jgi:nickel-dependent lactate racemase
VYVCVCVCVCVCERERERVASLQDTSLQVLRKLCSKLLKVYFYDIVSPENVITRTIGYKSDINLTT